MRIYGYTDEKETVAVDLSIDEIVAAGIDPWRLDLFDPDPVTLRIAGRELHFRRLQNICVAYKTGDWEVVLGMHDGVAPVCFSGTCDWIMNRSSMRVQNLRPYAHEFADLYRRYLTLLGAEPVDSFDCFWREDSVERSWLPPFAAHGAEMRGAVLILGVRQAMLPKFSYVGEMFADLSVRTQLPPEVSWVFQEFGRFEPVVEIPAEVLTGAPLKKMRLRVRDDDGLTVISWLRAKGRKAKQYQVHSSEMLNDANTRLHNWDHMETSADWIRCSRPDEVWCTRIGYFDLAQRQTRALTLMYYLADREIELLKQNFNTVDGPFTTNQKTTWRYKLLKAHVPGSKLLYNLGEFCDSTIDVCGNIKDLIVDVSEDLWSYARSRFHKEKDSA